MGTTHVQGHGWVSSKMDIQGFRTLQTDRNKGSQDPAGEHLLTCSPTLGARLSSSGLFLGS